MNQNDKISEIKQKKPIVGILVKKNHIKRLLVKQRALLKHSKFITASEKSGIMLYFFSVDDFHIKSSTVKGAYFNQETCKWEKCDFPYPDFIYKSYGWKVKEKKHVYFEKQLKKLNIVTINYLYCFDKWEVYQHLCKNKELLPHLPLTKLYTNKDSLKKMLECCDKVYLKCCRSGLGRGVMCIEKLPEGYTYSYFANKLYVNKVKDFNSLAEEILVFYKKRKFIVQKAINLIKTENRIIDIRSEPQRKGDGSIEATALIVRVSSSNSPITTHACKYTFEDYFKNFLGYSSIQLEELRNRLIALIKIIYQAVEASYGQSGELSIDIGLDQDGDLWFIECNAYSSKVSFYDTYDEETINKSYLNILEYAEFLFHDTINFK